MIISAQIPTVAQERILDAIFAAFTFAMFLYHSLLLDSGNSCISYHPPHSLFSFLSHKYVQPPQRSLGRNSFRLFSLRALTRFVPQHVLTPGRALIPEILWKNT